jgi:glycosyltransferase involved in cell wall biosynthesis
MSEAPMGGDSHGTTILVVGTRAPTVGGISSVVEDHIAALSEMGWTVEVVNTGARLRRRPGRASIENVLALLADAGRVLRSCFTVRPSVAAVHGVGSPLMPLARLTLLVGASRLARVPTVVHLHAYDLERSLSVRRFRLSIRLLTLVADVVTALHPALAVELAAVTGRPVRVVPNFVDTDLFRPATDEQRSDEVTQVVFVGTVGRRKGVPTLLDAVARVDSTVHLTVVGGAGEEPEVVHRSILAEAQDLVDAGVVTFTGELDRDAARAQLERSDLFVLPSTGEGMPMALLEAMACGLPSIVSDSGAMGAMVTSADAGMVVPVGDAAALASALDAAAGDPAWRRAAGAGARSWVERTHGRRVGVRELDGLYRSVRRRARRQR